MPKTRLSALDLTPIPDGSTAADAITDSLALAARLEHLGYHRVWYAEHHFVPGVASVAPAVMATLAADRTSSIRVGSGAVLLGSTSPAMGLEQFATLARVHPGRVDLGLGRANPGPPPAAEPPDTTAEPASAESAPVRAVPKEDRGRTIDGVALPAAPPSGAPEVVRQRMAATREVVGVRAQIPDYGAELRTVLQLLDGTLVTSSGDEVRSPVAQGADLQVFTLASSAGESAQAAAALGLPLVANYHSVPSAVLQTVASYREHFVPGVLAEPYVVVSADVLAAPTPQAAQERAAGFDAWVHSIRAGEGAIRYPRPQQVPPAVGDEALIADRLASRIVGDPSTVVRRLATLQSLTGADELLLTTITHDPAHRVESYDLIARHWRPGAIGGE